MSALNRQICFRKPALGIFLVLTTIGTAVFVLESSYQILETNGRGVIIFTRNRLTLDAERLPSRELEKVNCRTELSHEYSDRVRYDKETYGNKRKNKYGYEHDSTSRETSLHYDGQRKNETKYTYCGITYSKEMDILGLDPIVGLPEFKNPCWYEGSCFRCFPYFFLIGAPKTGTTDLYKRLVLHPQFVKPSSKEPNWLGQKLFKRKMKMLQYLSTYFHQPAKRILKDFKSAGASNSTLITGDASTTYIFYHDFWPIMPGNRNRTEPVYTNAHYIHHMNPKAKIILSVRNPIDRTWSGYLYSSKGIKSADTFHDTVVKATQMYRDCFKVRSVRSCVHDRKLYLRSTSVKVDDSPTWKCPLDGMHFRVNVHLRSALYAVFLKDYLRVFPRNQVFVQRLEDRAMDIGSSMKEIFSFLEMDEPSERVMKKIVGASKTNVRSEQNMKVGKMKEETRRILYDFYKPFNEELAELLGDEKFNYGLR